VRTSIPFAGVSAITPDLSCASALPLASFETARLRAQVMSMIPGFSNALMPPGHEKESGAKIKRYMCIMDSMTNAELDSSDPKLFTVGAPAYSRNITQ
jgi:Signal peptide binding domain